MSPKVTPGPAVPEALGEARAALLSYARRRVGPAAEDVVQEASVRALEKSAQLADPAAARAWLFTIVRRLLTERAARPAPLPLDVEPPAPEAPEPDACGCVLKQIDALGPARAALLTRVVVDGVPVEQVARELGITSNNAWVRLHRARAALRRRLQDHCGTDSLRACLDCGCLERGCCR